MRADAPRNGDALLEAAAPGEAPARWFQRYTGVRATPPAMRKFAR